MKLINSLFILQHTSTFRIIKNDFFIKLFLEIMDRINREVSRLHNPELLRDTHVYHLYSDGEVTIEKAGELYGFRTRLMIFPAMYETSVFSFPLTCGRYTFAILTYENILYIRELMTKCMKSNI